MPSTLHEALLRLFDYRPALAPELLRDVLGIELPPFDEVRSISAELAEVAPATYRADDAILLLRSGGPALVVVVEAQLHCDARKRFTWPVYLAELRARHECPAVLLVLAPDRAIAGWCAEPIPMGQPEWVLHPFVLGPDAVPVIADPERAKRDPELAVLSVIAHGHGERSEHIGAAVLAAAAGLDEERSRLYADLAFLSLGDAARRALEGMMQSGKYEYQSDFARKYFAQGREAGREAGREEGRVEGRAESVLAILEARGLEVSADARARILGCADLATIDLWLRRALTAPCTDALFDGAEPSSRPL